MTGKAIGVDLGGTFIKAGVVNAKGQILSRVSVPTHAEKGRKEIVSRIASAADQARKEAGLTWRGVRAIGLGCPGTIDGTRGIVHQSPNLRWLEGCRLVSSVSRALGRENVAIMLDNDANLAGYAEMWMGAGRDMHSLVLITLGTGIGGAVVLNGEIWRGTRGIAGEVGHHAILADGVPCPCGSRGCVERYASASALERRFAEAVRAGRRSRLASRIKGGYKVTARDICMAAREGDRLSIKLMTETGRYLGVLAANMLNILNVECLVFTGGMTAAGSLLLKPIREEARMRASRLAIKGVKIVFSRLGNDAGLIGAAGLALRGPRRSAGV